MMKIILGEPRLTLYLPTRWIASSLGARLAVHVMSQPDAMNPETLQALARALRDGRDLLRRQSLPLLEVYQEDQLVVRVEL